MISDHKFYITRLGKTFSDDFDEFMDCFNEAKILAEKFKHNMFVTLKFKIDGDWHFVDVLCGVTPDGKIFQVIVMPKKKRFPNFNYRVQEQMDMICDELNELHEIYIIGDAEMPYCEMEEYNELYEWYSLMCKFLNMTVEISRKYKIGIIKLRRK